jgi:peptidoglycan-N-acetylglucosamine deacetylase
MLQPSFIPGMLALALALVSCAGDPAPATANSPTRTDPAALQAACFLPAALAANPEEKSPRRLLRAQPMVPPQSVAGQAPIPPTPTNLRGAIRRVELPPGSRKLIALTLDFCEQAHEIAGYDGAIIDILRRKKVKATLFMGGKWMVSHSPRTQQLMADPLFELGTHGWAHRNVRGLAGNELIQEITAPSRAYQSARAQLSAAQCSAPHSAALSAIPAQVSLYRFPFGACHADSLAAVNAAGLMAIQWDLSTGDPSPATTARDIAATMIRNARPGSIIIAHANGRGFNTAEALPAAIAGLRAKGFEFVTVTELLAAGKPVIAPTCYDSRPGDTDKYDRFFSR